MTRVNFAQVPTPSCLQTGIPHMFQVRSNPVITNLFQICSLQIFVAAASSAGVATSGPSSTFCFLGGEAEIAADALGCFTNLEACSFALLCFKIFT